MQKEIIIIGGGGFAKVLIDAIILEAKFKIAGFCIDNIPIGNCIFEKYSVISDTKLSSINEINDYYFIIALGDNQIRKRFYQNALLKCKPARIIHPSAIIGSAVEIGNGTVVMANAVINAYSSIGNNTIINTGVIIDHDSKIGNHVHLKIGTLVGGNSDIADNLTTKIGEFINSFSNL
jgi:acetyltransferase EpsM